MSNRRGGHVAPIRGRQGAAAATDGRQRRRGALYVPDVELGRASPRADHPGSPWCAGHAGDVSACLHPRDKHAGIEDLVSMRIRPDFILRAFFAISANGSPRAIYVRDARCNRGLRAENGLNNPAPFAKYRYLCGGRQAGRPPAPTPPCRRRPPRPFVRDVFGGAAGVIPPWPSTSPARGADGARYRLDNEGWTAGPARWKVKRGRIEGR